MNNRSFAIITDGASDLTAELARDLDVDVAPMICSLGKREFTHYADCREMSRKEFYTGMRNGEITKTVAVSPLAWEEEMERSLAAGRDVLVMPFSAELSASYANAVITASALRQKYPERLIEVVNTLCVSLGLIMLLKRACEYRAAGLGPLETKARIDAEKLTVCHYFTVEDLKYLHRGGRVSAASAFVGGALGIKPILHVNDEGALVNIAKVRGRKKSIAALTDYMERLGADLEEQSIVIVHADCIDDAEQLKETVIRRFRCREVAIVELGPAVGSHTGPGLIAITFFGRGRS